MDAFGTSILVLALRGQLLTKNTGYLRLTVNEVISNWKNSIKEKGEPPYLGGMYEIGRAHV